MRKATILILVFLVAPMVAAENPDSRPSITFALGGSIGGGNYNLDQESLDRRDHYTNYGMLIKLPLAESITLSFGSDYLSGNSDYEANLLSPHSKSTTSQVDYTLSITLYIGPSINK